MEHKDIDIFRQTVSESDIDWLFCVELNSSKQFRKLIGSIVFPEVDNFGHVRAWRSISNTIGESDLVWLIEHPSKGRLIILIENKINATAQPEQYNRYVQRGNKYIKEGIANEYLVALLSPKSYSSADSSDYPVYIHYEHIIEWLQLRQDERSKYICSLYKNATNKKISPIIVDEENLHFRENVYHLAKKEFPLLNVVNPKSDCNNIWISMRYPGYEIVYKTFKKNLKYTGSVVDLVISGRGNDVELLKARYVAPLKETGISVEKTGKSASFRLNVPMIEPPKFNEDKVRDALLAAMKLKSFWDKLLTKVM